LRLPVDCSSCMPQPSSTHYELTPASATGLGDELS
jgi:hypothetical protein